VFPNEKRELSAGWRAAQKGGPAGCGKGRGGLQKRVARRPALICSPLAHPVVQPAGPPFCAARQSAENSCFSFGNTALRLVLSIDFKPNFKTVLFQLAWFS